MKTLLRLLAASALIGCGDPTGPAALLGSWTTPVNAIGSGYAREERLIFGSDGTLEHRMRIYRSGRVETTHDFTYNYTVRNDSLFTSPAGITTDVLYMTPFNRGKLDIDGGRLTITYPWFGPADEPVTVTQVFFGTPCSLPVRACF